MLIIILVRGAFFGEAGGWERPQFFLPEEKVLIIVITNLPMSLIILWQALKIEEYDWYGYGETYGSEAKLRHNYRYKQVWVWMGTYLGETRLGMVRKRMGIWVFGSDKVRGGKEMGMACSG